LDEALGSGVIEVTEVNDHGAVPNLNVYNKSPKMVLILDGEELVGAKQNRIVNTTILISANATVVIPVSCVEQGRWSYNTPRFYSEERIMPSRMRAMKSEQVQRSVRAHGVYQADQSAIWADIGERASRRAAMSPSMAMARIYEKDRSSLQEYLEHFSLIGSQVGAVFLINGKVVGMDGFGKPETFSRTFKKLVESYALDAIDWIEEGKDHKASKSEVTKFIQGTLACSLETHSAVGLGMDCRLESGKLTGFAFSLDDKVVHISIFARLDGVKGRSQTSRMARFSRRNRNRMQ
jgi:ARG and Rhodanese-Phosphatase-superfamily-associated Protein domain